MNPSILPQYMMASMAQTFQRAYLHNTGETCKIFMLGTKGDWPDKHLRCQAWPLSCLIPLMLVAIRAKTALLILL